MTATYRMYDLALVGHLYARKAPCGESVCTYCGDVATTWDHVAPVSYVAALHDTLDRVHEQIADGLFVVPACADCNSRLGSFVAHSISEKREELRARLLAKHKRLISGDEWADDELEALGLSLRNYLKSLEARRRKVLQRLAFAGEVFETLHVEPQAEEPMQPDKPERDILFQRGLRKCTRCGEIKDIGEFYRNKSNRQGRTVQCVACLRKATLMKAPATAHLFAPTTNPAPLTSINGERKPLPQSDCQDEHPRGISHDPDSKVAADFAAAQSDFGRRLVPRHMPRVNPELTDGDGA